MGEGNFGGDGSVNWDVRTTRDKADKFKDNPSGSNGRKREGADADAGSEFLVSLQVPKNMTADAFTASVKVTGGRLEVRLPIDSDDDDQIQVRWGDDANRGSGN